MVCVLVKFKNKKNVKKKLPPRFLIQNQFQFLQLLFPEIVKVIDPGLQIIKTFLTKQAVSLSTDVLDVYKSCLTKDFDVFGYGRTAHRKIFGQRIDGHAVFCEQTKDLPPAGI
jgi:hypothetical protein